MKPSTKGTAIAAGGGLIGVAATLITTAGEKLDSGDLTKVFIAIIVAGGVMGTAWIIGRFFARKQDGILK